MSRCPKVMVVAYTIEIPDVAEGNPDPSVPLNVERWDEVDPMRSIFLRKIHRFWHEGAEHHHWISHVSEQKQLSYPCTYDEGHIEPCSFPSEHIQVLKW